MPSVDPKNRLNDLDSREWLQFQKSWFVLEQNPVAEFIRFFTKQVYSDGHSGTVAVYPETLAAMASAEKAPRRQIVSDLQAGILPELDYIYVDLTDAEAQYSLRHAPEQLEHLLGRAIARLRQNAYCTLVARNVRTRGQTQPEAWQLARKLSAVLQQKDEKIGCLPPAIAAPAEQEVWMPDDSIYYFLNFRKENMDVRSLRSFSLSQGETPTGEMLEAAKGRRNFRESWFIHKPPPRSKDVILHPAKFPEDLIRRYLENFTAPGDLVCDPMAGTGSSLLAAVTCGRRAWGVELNPQFAEIARSRFIAFDEFHIINGDARDASSYAGLPGPIDYCITSPPYWDMLRMKGAETQAGRKAAGLPRWYSDDPRDLGNISEYSAFLDLLTEVYRLVLAHLRPGGYMTIIVKNVKKKGRIYPLAWDIVERLEQDCIFAGEQIWCQDDQRLAPFGYRYAWVSNTFHHYCLTFRKPAA